MVLKPCGEICNCLNPGGKVITFGYHSIVMGHKRNFRLEGLCLFSHGGVIHDTIATIERSIGEEAATQTELFINR
jgi:hypothetical protein